MSVQMIGQLGMLVLIALVFLRVPVAVAMGLVGFVGYALINGTQSALLVTGQVPYDIATNYTLAVAAVRADGRSGRALGHVGAALFHGA